MRWQAVENAVAALLGLWAWLRTLVDLFSFLARGTDGGDGGNGNGQGRGHGDGHSDPPFFIPPASWSAHASVLPDGQPPRPAPIGIPRRWPAGQPVEGQPPDDAAPVEGPRRWSAPVDIQRWRRPTMGEGFPHAPLRWDQSGFQARREAFLWWRRYQRLLQFNRRFPMQRRSSEESGGPHRSDGSGAASEMDPRDGR